METYYDVMYTESYDWWTLAENREYLKKGDYRLLYGVMEKCGYEPEDDEEPFFSSAQMESLPHPVEELLTFIQIE